MWAKTRDCIKSALNVFSSLLCLISSSQLEKKFWPAAKRSPLVSIIESWGCSIELVGRQIPSLLVELTGCMAEHTSSKVVWEEKFNYGNEWNRDLVS